jgi:CxxC motif-containing protein
MQKKSLKISNEYLEILNWRTDNTITKRKTTMIYKTLQKLKIVQHEPH